MDETSLIAGDMSEESQNSDTSEPADGQEVVDVATESDDLETLILQEIPDAYDSLAPVLGSCSAFLAGGVIIAFLFWTIGYAVNSSYKLLDDSTK